MEWNNKIAAMHGLDMAFPFLDRDLIAFLMAIPGEIQSWKGVHKGLLREALRGVLPEAIAGRVYKADFTNVVNEGIAKDHDQLVRYFHRGAMVSALGYVRAEGLTEMTRGTHANGSSTASWALGDLLSLELWLQEFFGPSGIHAEMEVC